MLTWDEVQDVDVRSPDRVAGVNDGKGKKVRFEAKRGRVAENDGKCDPAQWEERISMRNEKRGVGRHEPEELTSAGGRELVPTPTSDNDRRLRTEARTGKVSDHVAAEDANIGAYWRD